MLDETLLDSIKSNSFNRSELLLNGKGLSDDDIGRLVKALESNTYIKELDLSDNEITETGAAALATSKLQKLNISANRAIGDAVANFEKTVSLVELRAADCDVTDDGAEKLFASPSLKKLNLSSNKLKGACLKEIKPNSALEDLCLMQNSLLPAFLKDFPDGKSLLRLDLTNVLIGDEGAEFLANKSIKELVLIQCSIGNEGAIALARSSTIKKLKLYNNFIKDDGMKELSTNKSFIHLDIKQNPGDPTVLEASYQKSSYGIFTRDEAFIAELLKKELEPDCHESITEYKKSKPG